MQSVRTILLGAALLAVGTERAAAQTTYNACYVPSVGAIYLINQTGLPTACLAQSHVAFSWISGGAVADGSITLAKLAFDPATQTELNAVLTQMAAIGTINTSTNPMDWTQLKNVPAGLADGVDDGGGTASDVVCTSCVAASDMANSAVTTAKIANAAVTETKLSFDPATQAELNAVAGRVSGYEIRMVVDTVHPGVSTGFGVPCPVGKAAVGGGHFGQNIIVVLSAPAYGSGGSASGSAWSFVFRNDYVVDVVVRAYAVCVNTS